MKSLVVIPSNLLRNTFSAPLSWLLAHHATHVQGIFDHQLTINHVREYPCFIVELNWFTQLHRFLKVVKFIKKHNKEAPILFGGLYAGLKWREIFQMAPVDFFIKGDNELPLRLFLDQENPRKIPNLVGRDFENEQSYIYSLNDFKERDYDLSWFPSYQQVVAKLTPIFAQKGYPKRLGPFFINPILFSTKGGCLTAHAGCDYCLGSKHKELRQLFGRGILRLSNEIVINEVKKIEKKFPAFSFYVLSDPAEYDFRGEYFDLHAVIEFDSKASVEDLSRIIPAFKSATVHVALYEEGLTGKSARQNLDKFIELEDASHRLYFYGYRQDANISIIPKERWVYSEVVLPSHTSYDIYTDINLAMQISDYWTKQLIFPSYQLSDSLRTHVAELTSFCREKVKQNILLLRYKGDIVDLATGLCQKLDRELEAKLQQKEISANQGR
jgi:hypothetical protein